MSSPMTALGTMSGTSMDGIDLAVIETDGTRVTRFGPVMSGSYREETRRLLDAAVASGHATPRGTAIPSSVREGWKGAAEAVTRDHITALEAFAAAHPDDWARLEVIGFHGQTVLHRPDDRVTVQLGEGQALSRHFGRTVVGDFRSADVARGGQGAPFAPLYHQALAQDLFSRDDTLASIAVLNLGGVGNVTWIARGGDLLAFDTGPANGPTDDWVRLKTGALMDKDGALAAGGVVHDQIIDAMAEHPYFDLTPPKSLDRLDFGIEAVRTLDAADGAATLTAFAAESVRMACAHLPEIPRLWIACGGGRRNPVLMRELSARLNTRVVPAESVQWRGDDLEAEAFAFLAVRALQGLALSVPGTTGVDAPCPGGLVFAA